MNKPKLIQLIHGLLDTQVFLKQNYLQFKKNLDRRSL